MEIVRLLIIFCFLFGAAIAQEKCEILTRCEEKAMQWINHFARERLSQYETKLENFARDLDRMNSIMQQIAAPDKCSSVRNCSSNAVCVDTVYSYYCKCLSGYTGDGHTCTDINECSSAICDSNARCTNTEGTYTCTCNTGYQGNGRSCIDVDECSSRYTCSESASCKNTVGSYLCVCNPGYVGDGRTCSDKNECYGSNGCSHHSYCKNTIGSYVCKCRPGFIGNGFSCADVNECASSNRCDRDAHCINTAGSYKCSCRRGFVGTGYDCEECYLGNGHGYRGHVHRSHSGRYCQYWSSQSPHEHTRTSDEYPAAGLESNYCRNPDDEPRPWCYTTDRDRRWEFCSIPRC